MTYREEQLILNRIEKLEKYSEEQAKRIDELEDLIYRLESK